MYTFTSQMLKRKNKDRFFISSFHMEKQEEQKQTPHVAILSSPGIGHVIPLVEFAKRLVGNHGFTATFVVPTDGPPSNAMMSVLEGLPEAIDRVFLPPVRFDDLPEGSKIETRIFLTVSRSLPALRDGLASVISRRRVSLVAFVVDFLSIDASDVAREFNLSSYVFYPSRPRPCLYSSTCPTSSKRRRASTGSYRIQ